MFVTPAHALEKGCMPRGLHCRQLETPGKPPAIQESRNSPSFQLPCEPCMQRPAQKAPLAKLLAEQASAGCTWPKRPSEGLRRARAPENHRTSPSPNDGEYSIALTSYVLWIIGLRAPARRSGPGTGAGDGGHGGSGTVNALRARGPARARHAARHSARAPGHGPGTGHAARHGPGTRHGPRARAGHGPGRPGTGPARGPGHGPGTGRGRGRGPRHAPSRRGPSEDISLRRPAWIETTN